TLYGYLISFFLTNTATPTFYTLSLHDALPISRRAQGSLRFRDRCGRESGGRRGWGSRPARASWGQEIAEARSARRTRPGPRWDRSEEHTSELQSPCNLVCRLLLERKSPT